MPNYRRPRIPGATIFFTVPLARRGSDDLVTHIGPLRDAVRAARSERPFGIDARVVLPDHLHAVCTLPEGDSDFSMRWAAIKAPFGRDMRRAGFTPPPPPVGRENGGVNLALRRKGEIGLWQPQFWEHHIRDRRDYEMHVHYCWVNPVKHGFAPRPVDWPHSSIHRDIARCLVEADWAGTIPEGRFGEAGPGGGEAGSGLGEAG